MGANNQKSSENVFGRIIGVMKFGKAWAIPKDAERPKDERVTTGMYKNWRKKYKVTG